MQTVNGEPAATDARARAMMDLYNFISYATHAHYLFNIGAPLEHRIDPAFIFGVDEFAVTLGILSEKGTSKSMSAYITREAKAKSRTEGTSTKNANHVDKFQSKRGTAKVKIVLSICPTGHLSSVVYSIRESDYFLKKPKEDQPWTYGWAELNVRPGIF